MTVQADDATTMIAAMNATIPSGTQLGTNVDHSYTKNWSWHGIEPHDNKKETLAVNKDTRDLSTRNTRPEARDRLPLVDVLQELSILNTDPSSSAGMKSRKISGFLLSQDRMKVGKRLNPAENIKLIESTLHDSSRERTVKQREGSRKVKEQHCQHDSWSAPTRGINADQAEPKAGHKVVSTLKDRPTKEPVQAVLSTETKYPKASKAQPQAQETQVPGVRERVQQPATSATAKSTIPKDSMEKIEKKTHTQDIRGTKETKVSKVASDKAKSEKLHEFKKDTKNQLAKILKEVKESKGAKTNKPPGKPEKTHTTKHPGLKPYKPNHTQPSEHLTQLNEDGLGTSDAPPQISQPTAPMMMAVSLPAPESPIESDDQLGSGEQVPPSEISPQLSTSASVTGSHPGSPALSSDPGSPSQSFGFGNSSYQVSEPGPSDAELSNSSDGEEMDPLNGEESLSDPGNEINEHGDSDYVDGSGDGSVRNNSGSDYDEDSRASEGDSDVSDNGDNDIDDNSLGSDEGSANDDDDSQSSQSGTDVDNEAEEEQQDPDDYDDYDEDDGDYEEDNEYEDDEHDVDEGNGKSRGSSNSDRDDISDDGSDGDNDGM